ncbi:hypothetical protein JCM17823_04740 [Halorubrum gandharaense]
MVLLVVGITFALSFNMVGASMSSQSYVAEEVDPGEDLDALVVSSDVAEYHAASHPDAHVTAVETAVEEGSSRATIDQRPEQFVDVPYEYLVVDGTVYAYEASLDGDVVELSLTPADQRQVAEDVATPVDEAPPFVSEAVATGEAEGESPAGADLVRDGDTYYQIQPANPGAFVAQLVIAPISILLTSVGAAFIAAGGWLFASQYRGRRRALTPKRAGLVALAAAPVALVVILLFRSGGSPSMSVLTVLLSVAAGSLLLVGVLISRESYSHLAGVLAGAPFLVLLGTVPEILISGGVGFIFTGVLALVGLLFVGVVGSPLVVYGYRFAAPVETGGDCGAVDG